MYLHVEVDAGVLRKDGGEDLSEGLVGQDVVVIFEPLVKPAGPELAHQHRGVWSHSSDCFNLYIGLPLEVDRHQLVVDVAPVKGEGGGVAGEQQGLDATLSQLLLDETQVFEVPVIRLVSRSEDRSTLDGQKNHSGQTHFPTGSKSRGRLFSPPL